MGAESAAAMLNLASARKYFDNIEKLDLTDTNEKWFSKQDGKAVRVEP